MVGRLSSPQARDYRLRHPKFPGSIIVFTAFFFDNCIIYTIAINITPRKARHEVNIIVKMFYSIKTIKISEVHDSRLPKHLKLGMEFTQYKTIVIGR